MQDRGSSLVNHNIPVAFREVEFQSYFPPHSWHGTGTDTIGRAHVLELTSSRKDAYP